MQVKLVSFTAPHIEALDTPGDLIAYCARISNPNNQLNTGTADKLLAYLVKHQHWSPFEMADITVEITTTRDIARQILRHRSFVFQEFSQRYATNLKFEAREARLQDEKNRQNSVETSDSILHNMWMELQDNVAKYAEDTYKWAIDNGIAKEVARSVLPEGMTESRLYMKGNIRSWIHYINLRTGSETQKEHRLVAEECKTILLDVVPSVSGVLNG